LPADHKLPEIERLRAVAVLMVLWVHIPWLSSVRPNWTAFGWTGVDLFFVISGFVVARSWLRAEKQPSASPGARLTAFYTRRIFRILPMALTWMLLVFGASLFLSSTEIGEPLTLLRQIYAFLTFQLNYMMVFTHTLDTALGHYWSLAVEEHFYLILPLLFLFIRSLRSRILTCFGVAFCSLVLRYVEKPPAGLYAGEYVRFCSHFRFDALAAGVLVALAIEASLLPKLESAAGSFWRRRIALVFLALVFFGPSLVPAVDSVPGIVSQLGFAGVVFYSSVLVFLAAQGAGYVFEAPLLSPVLEYIGSRSFGLYLAHLPLFRILPSIYQGFGMSWPLTTSAASLIFTGGSIALTFVITEIFYRLLEKPLRDKGRRLSESSFQSS
jgi:peptidoglycan/LPS O-acetylase OafA/YrhL